MPHQPVETQQKTWLTIPEISHLTGDSPNTTRTWIKYLPSTYIRRTVGGQVRLRREAAEIILKNREKRAV